MGPARYARVPVWWTRALRGQASALAVGIALASYSDAAGTGARPSVATLAHDTGIAPRHVSAALARLRRVGVVKAVHMSRGAPTEYCLVPIPPTDLVGGQNQSTPTNSVGGDLRHNRWDVGAAPLTDFVRQSDPDDIRISSSREGCGEGDVARLAERASIDHRTARQIVGLVGVAAAEAIACEAVAASARIQSRAAWMLTVARDRARRMAEPRPVERPERVLSALGSRRSSGAPPLYIVPPLAGTTAAGEMHAGLQRLAHQARRREAAR